MINLELEKNKIVFFSVYLHIHRFQKFITFIYKSFSFRIQIKKNCRWYSLESASRMRGCGTAEFTLVFKLQYFVQQTKHEPRVVTINYYLNRSNSWHAAYKKKYIYRIGIIHYLENFYPKESMENLKRIIIKNSYFELVWFFFYQYGCNG